MVLQVVTALALEELVTVVQVQTLPITAEVVAAAVHSLAVTVALVVQEL
jgi:hypothetical protein